MNFNIQELKSKKYHLKHKVFAHFHNILNECVNEIKKTSSNTNKEYCNFIVPKCKLGDPIYNVNDLEHFIVKQLTNKDLFIVIEQPRLLYISWKDKDIDYVKQQRLMEDRRTQLQSEIDYFNDSYEPTAHRAMMVNDVLTQTTGQPTTRKLEQLKSNDICSHKSSSSRTSHSSHSSHSHKTKPILRKKQPTKPKTSKCVNLKKCEPSVVNMPIMYENGIQDLIPVDKDIYDIILEYQKGF